MRMKVSGVRQYLATMAALRLAVHMRLNSPRLRIANLCRTSELDVNVQWALHGIPRQSLFKGMLGYMSLVPTVDETRALAPVVLEGFFKYRFNSAGYLEYHLIDNVLPTQEGDQNILSRQHRPGLLNIDVASIMQLKNDVNHKQEQGAGT